MDFNIASYIHHNRLSRCSRDVLFQAVSRTNAQSIIDSNFSTCTNRASFISNILFRCFTLISVHTMSVPLITTDSFMRLKTIKRLLYGNSLFENKFTTSSTDVFASIFELEMSS